MTTRPARWSTATDSSCLRSPPERADGLAIHAFVQAWRNSEAVEPGRSFRPWLAVLTTRIASYEGIDVPRPAESELTEEWVTERIGDAATWPPPPLDLRDRVANAVLAEAFVAEAEPRRAAARNGDRPWLRPALIGVLATLLFLLIGTVVFSILGGADVGDERMVALQPTGLVGGASGDVTVVGTETGVRVEYDASELDIRIDGTFYEAWITTTDGLVIPIGSFRGGDDVVLTGAVELPDAAELTFALAAAVDASSESRPVPADVVATADLLP